MTNPKSSLAVAALKDGTVIDHIPTDALFKVVKLLDLENSKKQITIVNNLSGSTGLKGIIKIAEVFFPQEVLNRIAIIAPKAVVNIIKDYEVVEKLKVELPDTVVGLVKCDNPKCICNNEPMSTRFHVLDRENGVLRCHYCNHAIKTINATIL